MKSFIKNIWENHRTAFILVLCIVFIIVMLYKILFYTYITVQFSDARPFHHHAPVYYKGHKIGKIVHVRHSKDYMNTIVTLALFPLDLNLPENVTALLKINKIGRFEKDYIDIIYPEEPVKERLKNKSAIKGMMAINLQSYFANFDPDELLQYEASAKNAFANVEQSAASLNDLLVTLNSIAEENRSYINTSAKNFAVASKNTNVLTTRIDKTLTEEKFNRIVANADTVSNNVKTLTNSLIDMSSNIGGTTFAIEQSIPMLECALANATATFVNLNEITSGVKCTMSKPFGGFRLLFGKSINK